MLDGQAKVRGEKIAVAGERRSLTVKQLLDEAAATAAFFKWRGLQIGNAVMLGVPPAPEFYVVLYPVS